MYKLAIFDLDGTLADTLCDLANAVNTALAENSLAAHSVDEYRYLVGNGADMLIKRAIGDSCNDDLFKKVKTRFKEYYEAHMIDFTKPYDGVADMLRTLSESGVKTAVLSNKPNDFVPYILSTLYPDHSFTFSWGQRPDYERKPSPQALNAMIKLCGVDKSDVIYIGDSDVDVITAHNADIKVIGVDWGFRPKAELESAGADYIVSNTNELLSIILR